MSNQEDLKDIIIGDYNGDGVVDIVDAQGTLVDATNIISGIEPSILPEDQPKVDVDCDGDISVSDAQDILKYTGYKMAYIPAFFDDVVTKGLHKTIYVGYYNITTEKFYMDQEYTLLVPQVDGGYYRDLTEGVHILWYMYVDGDGFVASPEPTI